MLPAEGETMHEGWSGSRVVTRGTVEVRLQHQQPASDEVDSNRRQCTCCRNHCLGSV